MVFETGDKDEAIGWFELDDDGEDLNSEADEIFLSALRNRAADAGWSRYPEDTMAFHIWNIDHHELTVVLSLDDDELSQHILTYGIVFNGSRIVGDRMHSQLYDFEGHTEAAIDLFGAPEYLAGRAIEWFESILAWPIIRQEWYAYDQMMYQEWILANTGEEIIGTVGRRPGGPPDKVTFVRGQSPADWPENKT